MRRGRYIVHRRFADGIRATIGQRQIWRFCIPEMDENKADEKHADLRVGVTW